MGADYGGLLTTRQTPGNKFTLGTRAAAANPVLCVFHYICSVETISLSAPPPPTPLQTPPPPPITVTLCAIAHPSAGAHPPRDGDDHRAAAIYNRTVTTLARRRGGDLHLARGRKLPRPKSLRASFVERGSTSV